MSLESLVMIVLQHRMMSQYNLPSVMDIFYYNTYFSNIYNRKTDRISKILIIQIINEIK
jgi:hypothetical protein